MITILLSFFQSKLGKYLLISLGVAIALYSAYRYVFNKGVDYQKSIYQAEYVEKVNKILLEQKTKQEEAYKLGYETANKTKQIETKYITQKIEVEKIVEKYKDCKTTNEDYQNLKSKWEELR